ncbi:dihydrodipicolinate synthase family protein [Streptomyces sp. CHD11]|uniref:dihydrodipicolinate synthase family protein n=1 Tax=Streptomyces sp. CHD11 TaxID=2741325 RepID=UPI001BFC4732|nr:dihydrodipicolinate synthase family protein [Streptomyces sp. CHD11]MBT3155179.1 dihydrodipicolinate synthase family protein [Streptomyces sp. CHD11]
MAEQTFPQGIHVPLVTPFTPSGEVATEALEGLAHRVLDDGAKGIVALGTTAEVATLDAAEQREVVRVCDRVCRERGAWLTVGAGSNDTRASEAALAGLSPWPSPAAALVTVPAFTRPSQEGVIAHFTRLAEVSPVPLIVYDIPYRTALTLSAVTLRTLGTLAGVVAVKHATGGIGQETVRLMADPPPGFHVLAGDDLFVSPLLAMGASGGILATAHLATGRFAALHDAWRAGEVTRARPLGHALAGLSAACFREPNPSVVKGVLHERGLIPTPDVRLPLLPAGKAAVEEALEQLDRVES